MLDKTSHVSNKQAIKSGTASLYFDSLDIRVFAGEELPEDVDGEYAQPALRLDGHDCVHTLVQHSVTCVFQVEVGEKRLGPQPMAYNT